MAAANNQLTKELPKREKDLLGQVQHFFERKDYDTALKHADQILTKFPEHGETLALKGLIWYNQDKKEEGLALSKQGLMKDLKSSTCWHCLGLIHRSGSNYKEASKCFLNAIRIDPNNQTIIRDLSFLQIQLRDFPGFLESRRKAIVARTGIKQNWLGYIVAQYFSGDYATAFDLITQMQDAWVEGQDRYEMSEVLLFQNRCLERQGKYSEALDHLNRFGLLQISDKLAVDTKRAELLLRLGRFEDSAAQWRALLDIQPDNYRMHCGLQVATLRIEDAALVEEMLALTKLDLPCTVLVLSEEQRSTLAQLYVNPTTGFATGAAAKRILLTVLPFGSETHRSHLDAFMRKRIASAIPSLYNDLLSLVLTTVPNVAAVPSDGSFSGDRQVIVSDMVTLRAHPLVAMIREMVAGYVTNLRATRRFSPAAEGEEADTEPASSLLWAMFLQCHMQEMCGEYEAALATASEMVLHTPTACDMYLKKARILKKLGDYKAASEVADLGRSLDLQDRFLNNKVTKYFLRADSTVNAMNTIAMFTKHDGNPQKILESMQCAWYELELGESCERQRYFGLGLKKFHSVQKHFIDSHEDMFDFHMFCIRKHALRAYTDILTMLDGLYQHKNYQRAARGAIRLYLRIHAGETSNPDLFEFPPYGDNKDNEGKEGEKETAAAEGDENEEGAAAGGAAATTGGGKKKKNSRARKAAKKAAAAGDSTSSAADAKKKEEEEAEAEAQRKRDHDPDPHGLTFLATVSKDPLGEASKWCANLTKYPTLEPATQALVCEVYTMRRKFTLAMRALVCGFTEVDRRFSAYYNARGMKHPELLVALTRFALQLTEAKNASTCGGASAAHPAAMTVIDAQLASLLGGQDIISFINDIVGGVARDSPALDFRVAVVKCVALCNQHHAAAGAAAGVIAPVALSKALELVTNFVNWEVATAKLCISTLKALTSAPIQLASDSDIVANFTAQCRTKYPHCESFGGLGTVVNTLEVELSSIHKSSYGILTDA